MNMEPLFAVSRSFRLRNNRLHIHIHNPGPESYRDAFDFSWLYFLELTITILL